MQTAIAQFLRFLAVERNAAELTVKSYREDLVALDEYLGQAYRRSADPAEITPLDLRGYVSAMHEAGYAKTSISRGVNSVSVGGVSGFTRSLHPVALPRRSRSLCATVVHANHRDDVSQ